MEKRVIPGTDIPVIDEETLKDDFVHAIITLLKMAGLEKTMQGLICIEASARRKFTDFQKTNVAYNFPYNSKYTEYVQTDQILKATQTLINIEKAIELGAYQFPYQRFKRRKKNDRL